MHLWRQSEIMKNKKFRVLLLLEVILLLVFLTGSLRGDREVASMADMQVTAADGTTREETGYTIDSSTGISGPWLTLEGFSLKPGLYCYYVSYDTEYNGEDCLAIKPVTGRSYPCIVSNDTCFLGFPHLYYPSNPAFVKNFIRKAKEYGV